MSKYIDADKLIAEIKAWRNKQMGFAWDAVNEVLEIISSLQQEPRFPEENSIVEKVFGAGNLESWEYREAAMLVALAKEELLKSLQQEQPKRKLVKVRCVFPFDKTWEKDKIYTCEVWHHGDLNRNFLDVYYDYGKDPKYVQFPTIESLNEEFAIIKDESQVIPEQTEVDLEKEIDKESQKLHTAPCYDELKKFAKYFYELGLNARKEESVGVAESPSKTFPIVNEFEYGSGYRH